MSSRDAALIRCELCPKECTLGPWQRGDCRVRISDGEKLVTLVYGKPCAVHVDPIEKKPMFHFLPGSGSFSIATAGCNLHCKYCQNWDISQSNAEETNNADVPPEKAVALARRYDCASIAYTYSEPLIHLEYVLEASRMARAGNLKNVLVTNGFIESEPAEDLLSVVDAANVDLKTYSEEFYSREIGGGLEPVKRFLTQAAGRIHLEVTTLVIPGRNDSRQEIEEIARFLADLSPDIPYHLSCRRLSLAILLSSISPCNSLSTGDFLSLRNREGFSSMTFSSNTCMSQPLRWIDTQLQCASCRVPYP